MEIPSSSAISLLRFAAGKIFFKTKLKALGNFPKTLGQNSCCQFSSRFFFPNIAGKISAFYPPNRPCPKGLDAQHFFFNLPYYRLMGAIDKYFMAQFFEQIARFLFFEFLAVAINFTKVSCVASSASSFLFKILPAFLKKAVVAIN